MIIKDLPASAWNHATSSPAEEIPPSRPEPPTNLQTYLESLLIWNRRPESDAIAAYSSQPKTIGSNLDTYA
jgi:hypothetical protein